MKNFRNISLLTVSVCLAVLVGTGCKNKQALQALSELTTQLAEKADANNDKIANVFGEFGECKTALGKLGKQPDASPDATRFALPVLGEKITMAALEAYKMALNTVLEEQNTKMEELEAAGSTCTEQLAEAKQAAARTATTARRTTQTKKPIAVQKAEEAGTATKGVRSRYKTRSE